MLSVIVGSIVGHTGRVIQTALYPTEHGDHMVEMFSGCFQRMLSLGMPCPQIIWVDDWRKWHNILENLMQEHWPNAIGVVGQDWFHFSQLELSPLHLSGSIGIGAP